MEVDRGPKLNQLYGSISALNRSVRQHICELEAAPEHVRKLWAEIEELRNLVQHGQSLNMNFDILDAKRREEAAEIVQNASDDVSSLRITLDTICGHDTAEEITATLSEQECEQYIHNISEYRDKLAGTLDILQIEYMRRLVTTMRENPETLRYFQVMNEILEGDLELATPTGKTFRPRRTDGHPLIDNGNSREEAKFANRPKFAKSYVTTRIPQGRCEKRCKCRCHKASMFPLPSSFCRAFRRAFPSISDDPVLVRRCTRADCRALQSGLRRLFVVVHKAFVSRAIVLAAISRGLRIKLQIKSYPLVSDTSDVMEFAHIGNLDGMKRLFSDGLASPRDTAPDGWTLLHVAAHYGRKDMVQFLINQNADVNMGEIKLRKAYHFAKFRALTQGATQLELDVASAFPNADDFRYDFDLSPVLSAVLRQYDSADAERPTLDAIIDFAKKAITAPLDVDWSQRKRELRGRSPLFQEVIVFFQNAGSTEGARLGAFYDFLDSPDALQTWTPIQWAAYVDRKHEFDLLLKNGIPRQLLKLTPSRRNVLHQAAESGTQDILTYALEGQLHLQGVDINLPDIWDETPLHVATGRSSKSVALLLDHGADINARQSDGQVPLHYTKFLSGKDRSDCIKHFLKRDNPPVNVRDVKGKSPIFYLLDSPDCVKLLIDSGADTGISDIEGKTLLHHACAKDYPETLELIIKHFPKGLEARADKEGCTPLQICFQNQKVLCARILLRETMVAQAKDKNGWSLIHNAVRMGDETVLRQVIALKDTNIRARTNDGQSVFDIARSKGTFYTIIGEILREAMHMSAEDFEELDRDKPSSWELMSIVRRVPNRL